MPRFSDFDTRGYRTVDPRTGYAGWAATYEDTVEDAMDLALLEQAEVDWAAAREAADLGCGTGRIGAWMRGRGVGAVDGVDLTTEMLSRAAERGAYRRLVEAEVGDTGLEAGAYDLAISCLVDEHLPSLSPLYDEAARLVRPGGSFVLVGYHPQFIMASGIPTHYDDASGEPVAIHTHVHLIGEHVSAGLEAGMALAEMRERVVDDEWVALKPGWERWRDHPVSFALVWRAP